jgi:pyruvate formate lyase activating enzyme
MAIQAFQGTTLLDYPGKVASLVFFSGCNLRCGFCHNSELLHAATKGESLTKGDLMGMLDKRLGFIQGVVLSGGEATLDPNLFEIASEIKSKGLAVKLDTNGLNPDVLETLLERQLLDCVGMDVKTSVERYGELHHLPVDCNRVQQSIDILQAAPIAVEFRTTCVPGLVESNDIQAIGSLLKGADHWVLQQFVPDHALSMDVRRLTPHDKETIEGFALIARSAVKNVSVRGL